MLSMTGYGRGMASGDLYQIIAELKTVNHRFLEVRFKLPQSLQSVERTIDKLIRDRLGRGYCIVHIQVARPECGDGAISDARLQHYLDHLTRVAKQRNLPVEALLPLLASAPDLFNGDEDLSSDEAQRLVTSAVEIALEKLLRMRKAEGEIMGADIGQLIDRVRHQVRQIADLADKHAQDVVEHYRQRISELMSSADITPDSGRLEMEAAILADKADIHEEITRLFSHLQLFEKLLGQSGAIGRKMEFLLQELSRETNTIGSKTTQAEATHLVVAIKGELEKIRELAANIE